jgi:hypothetical protein
MWNRVKRVSSAGVHVDPTLPEVLHLLRPVHGDELELCPVGGTEGDAIGALVAHGGAQAVEMAE